MGQIRDFFRSDFSTFWQVPGFKAKGRGISKFEHDLPDNLGKRKEGEMGKQEENVKKEENFVNEFFFF